MKKVLLGFILCISISAHAQIPCSVTIVDYPITTPCCYDSLVAVVTDSSICGPWHFLWNTTDTTQWQIVTTPGTYIVNMYNSGINGCCGQDSASITLMVGPTYHSLLGDTTEWDIQYNVFPVMHDRSYYIMAWNYSAQGDTLVNGLHYKNFGQIGWPNAFIREDTVLQKVWFLEYGSSQELLLYDFSLNQGDSVNLTFPNYFVGGPYPNGWYQVDSIVTRNIFAGPRKHFYLSNSSSPLNGADNNNRFYLVWIEGVGSTIHPAYIYYDQQYGCASWCGPFTFQCPIFLDMALSCEYKNDIKQYWDTCMFNCFCYVSTVDSCQYFLGGGVEEYNNVNKISLSPNPATNELRVQRLTFNVKRTEVYSILGEKIISQRETTIDVSDLIPGIYFVHVRGEKTFAVGKFVKQ